MKGKIRKFLYDHWLIVFSVIFSVIFSAFIVGLPKWIVSHKNFLKSLFREGIPIWVVITIFGIFLIFVLVQRKFKRTTGRIRIITLQPKEKIQDLGEVKIAGVVWKIWIGSDTPFMPLENKRVWADGPFCPYCDYKLDWDFRRNIWKCIKCGRRFKIPKDLRDDTREKIIKIVEAELRKQQKYG